MKSFRQSLAKDRAQEWLRREALLKTSDISGILVLAADFQSQSAPSRTLQACFLSPHSMTVTIHSLFSSAKIDLIRAATSLRCSSWGILSSWTSPSDWSIRPRISPSTSMHWNSYFLTIGAGTISSLPKVSSYSLSVKMSLPTIVALAEPLLPGLAS